MKKIIFTVAILLFIIFNLNAQNAHNLEVELDPLAYALGGASGHIAFAWKNKRFQLGYGQLSMPESIRNHKNIKESFKAISLKWDYFFSKENSSKGFFMGPILDYLFLKYEDESNNSFRENQIAVGIRGGYRFNLFQKSNALNRLYVTPWIGASWLTKQDDLKIGEQTYKRKSLNTFPTVHIGWSF